LRLGWGELTCGRCLNRTRSDIRQIVQRAALMLPEAMVVGVDSEAANLAGPAADPEAWSWRKVAAKQGVAWHLSLVEDDDDWHPYTVLSRWGQMLSEDYRLDRPDAWTLTNAADFLTRILHRVAHDEHQDYQLLAREMTKCRTHLEAVMRDSQAPERGAPCPDCMAVRVFVQLVRVYPHWCDDPECCREHAVTDEADIWVCPRDEAHWWTAEGYAEYERDRKKVGA
jgi:hypothetical protein